MSRNGQTLKKNDVPRRRRDHGGAAVEFALVLPLFMALVMGALDYGFFFFSDQVVTNSAREGARAGTMVDPAGTPPTSGAQSSAKSAATTAAQQYMTNNGVKCPAGGSTCITSTYTTLSGQPAIDVVIQYPTVSLTGFTSIVLPRNVYAHAVMRWQ